MDQHDRGAEQSEKNALTVAAFNLPLPPKLPPLPAGPPQSLVLLLDEARNQAGNQHAIRQAISMQSGRQSACTQGGAISMCNQGGAISMQWGRWRRLRSEPGRPRRR